MLSISDPLLAGDVDYYVKYYKKHAKAQGVWFGKGAKKLGLGNHVEHEQFRSLLLGYNPESGYKLVQNAGRGDRQGGWDLTFSAPKSVSVLWSMLPPAERDVIERIHTSAVREVLTIVEIEAGLTRRGKAGKRVEQADLAFACFNDYTSRALDPQLHTHAILLNVALRKDGMTGAIRSNDLFEMKMAFGALYRLTLAAKLSENCALKIEPDETGFRLKDVPELLCTALSKRRAQIKAELSRRGQNDAIAAKAAALKTRETAKEAHLEELFAAWQRVGESHSFGPKAALAVFHRAQEHGERVTQNETPTWEKPRPNDANGSSFKEFNESCKKAEKKAFSEWKSYQYAALTARFIAEQLFHIRTYKFTLPIDPLRTSGSLWTRKSVIIPYLALGPRRQRWGFIRKRLFVGRYGELRVQERILFPRASLAGRLLGWRLPALRWASYKTIKRDAEWADRRGSSDEQKETRGFRFRNGWGHNFDRRREEEEQQRQSAQMNSKSR